MSPDDPRLPSNRELLVRIQKNLKHAQGFLEVLNEEIDNPSKKGPGADRANWKRDASALQDQLRQLEQLLTDIEMGDPHV